MKRAIPIVATLLAGLVSIPTLLNGQTTPQIFGPANPPATPPVAPTVTTPNPTLPMTNFPVRVVNWDYVTNPNSPAPSIAQSLFQDISGSLSKISETDWGISEGPYQANNIDPQFSALETLGDAIINVEGGDLILTTLSGGEDIRFTTTPPAASQLFEDEERMTILSEGVVSINTPSPGSFISSGAAGGEDVYRLFVNEGYAGIRGQYGRAANIVLMPNDGGNWWNIANSHGGKLSLMVGDPHSNDWNEDTDWDGAEFTFTSAGGTGKLGIGTSSPADRIHVMGGAIRLEDASSAKTGQVVVSHSSGSWSDFATAGDVVLRSNDEDLILSARSTSGAVRIGTGAADAERVTILSNGNVGIGTNNPIVPLAVDGLICAEEVRVSLSGSPCWPDYVFADDYELKSLAEVEAYIKENRHLPNIPSAADVEAGGVELGELNMRLLEKVEELTLYVIKLEKDQRHLREQIDQRFSENSNEQSER